MKIKMKSVAIIALALAITGIAAAMALDAWTTSGSNGEGNGNGRNGIRGSSTFTEISAQTGISEQDLLTAFGVPSEDPDALTCGDLVEFYPDQEVGTSAVRLFVDLYLGEEADLSGDASIPEPGVRMLLEAGALTPEEETYLDQHTVQAP